MIKLAQIKFKSLKKSLFHQTKIKEQKFLVILLKKIHQIQIGIQELITQVILIVGQIMAIQILLRKIISLILIIQTLKKVFQILIIIKNNNNNNQIIS